MGSDGCAHECFDTYNEMQNADTLYTVLLLTRALTYIIASRR